MKEGVDRSAGILPLGIGVQVEERKEEEGPGRQAEAGAQFRGVGARRRHRDRVGHRQDGQGRLEGYRLPGELARAPDLVEIIEARDPRVRKFRQFPGEVTDVVPAGSESPPVMMIDVAQTGLTGRN